MFHTRKPSVSLTSATFIRHFTSSRVMSSKRLDGKVAIVTASTDGYEYSNFQSGQIFIGSPLF